MPNDIKEKVREVLKGATDSSVKMGEFGREYEKKHGEAEQGWALVASTLNILLVGLDLTGLFPLMPRLLKQSPTSVS